MLSELNRVPGSILPVGEQPEPDGKCALHEQSHLNILGEHFREECDRPGERVLGEERPRADRRGQCQLDRTFEAKLWSISMLFAILLNKCQ